MFQRFIISVLFFTNLFSFSSFAKEPGFDELYQHIQENGLEVVYDKTRQVDEGRYLDMVLDSYQLLQFQTYTILADYMRPLDCVYMMGFQHLESKSTGFLGWGKLHTMEYKMVVACPKSTVSDFRWTFILHQMDFEGVTDMAYVDHTQNNERIIKSFGLKGISSTESQYIDPDYRPWDSSTARERLGL